MRKRSDEEEKEEEKLKVEESIGGTGGGVGVEREVCASVIRGEGQSGSSRAAAANINKINRQDQ